jgi:hypothetical protein
LTWRPPGFKFFDPEGGNVIAIHNNIGLPGTDVVVSDKSNYILMVGSSFMEAREVGPEKKASGILQKEISLKDQSYQVVNLGTAGNDLFINWFRVKFFSRYFPPKIIVILVESQSESWLERYTRFDYDLPENFGTQLTLRNLKYYIRAINSYSLWSLLITEAMLKGDTFTSAMRKDFNNSKDRIESNKTDLSDSLLCCLAKYSELCPKILVVSINKDKASNERMREFCMDKGIAFISDETIMSEENRFFHGQGHLNENGNHKLGHLISESIIRSFEKDDTLAVSQHN